MLQKKRSKRIGLFLRLLFGGGLVLIPMESMAQQKIPPPSGWADTVVVNGKVATMNDAQRFVEALAIRGDRLAAVGTRQDVEKFAGPQTKVIDAKGRTVVPGIFGTHEHPHLWIGLFHDSSLKASPQWYWTPAIAKTPQEGADMIKKIIQDALPQRKPKEWILVKTNEQGGRAIDEKLLTTEILDQLAPNNPVCVDTDAIDAAIGRTGKTLTGNEAGRRSYAGYGPPLRALSGPTVENTLSLQIHRKLGSILDDFQRDQWQAKGCRLGSVDLYVIPDMIGVDAYAEAIQRELQLWVETQGVTTHVTTWFRVPTVLTAYSKLAAEKKMPARVAWYTWHGQHNVGSQTAVGDPYLWNVGVEYEGITGEETIAAQLDPSLWDTPLQNAMTMASTLPLKEPRLEKVRADYINDALHALPGMPGRESVMQWLRKGIPVRDEHGYSDGAVDMFIDILKQLQQETGWSDEKIAEMRNFYIVHSSLVRPDQIPWLKKYGMSIGPSTRCMYDLPALKIAYGEEVKKYVWPVKSLLNAGVVVAPNYDMNPTGGPDGEGIWSTMQFLIDREYANEVWNIAEAVDRWTAMKTYTINGAWVALREKELGSLEVGKYADLVVLDKDYFTIPVKEIWTIAPLLTMVGGKVVFQKATF